MYCDRTRLFLVAALAATLAIATPASADDEAREGLAAIADDIAFRKGQDVIVLGSVELRVPGKVVTTAAKGDKLSIEEMKDKWLWVRKGDSRGWVDRATVMSAALQAWYKGLPDRTSIEKSGTTRAVFEGVMFEITNAGFGPAIISIGRGTIINGREIPAALLHADYANVGLKITGTSTGPLTLSLKFPGGTSIGRTPDGRPSYGTVEKGYLVRIDGRSRAVSVNGVGRRARR